MKSEWATAAEHIDGQLQVLERKRRQTAAAASRLASLEQSPVEAPQPAGPDDELAMARAAARQRGLM